MKFSGRTILLCLVLCGLGLGQEASPDSPATKEDIERYLSVVHSHEMMAQTMAAMSRPLHKMVHDEYLKDKDKLPPDFEAETDKKMDEMFQNMPFDEMMQAMVPVYQKHFTKGDVDSLVAFYSSPTGQKLLQQMPAIMAESMESAMPIMQRYMETVKQRVQDQIAEQLKKSDTKTD